MHFDYVTFIIPALFDHAVEQHLRGGRDAPSIIASAWRPQANLRDGLFQRELLMRVMLFERPAATHP